jgi:CheY-like chemotaxis protein
VEGRAPALRAGGKRDQTHTIISGPEAKIPGMIARLCGKKSREIEATSRSFLPRIRIDSQKMTPASIVLIEDHTLVRHLLATVLKEDPALTLVGGFSTVAEGINACLELAPTLVIIDWMLPDGKGIDVVRALSPKLANTRFLFLSRPSKRSTSCAKPSTPACTAS